MISDESGGSDYDANAVSECPSSSEKDDDDDDYEDSPSKNNNITSTPSLSKQQTIHPRLYVPQEDSAAYITVSDPTQHTEGIKSKYITYRVGYDPPPPPPPPTSAKNNDTITASKRSVNRHFLFPYATSVNRRYSDFSWLHDHLHKERPGAIVPPLPEKQQVSRFNESFVEERRFYLEVFLRRVVCNPELKDAECLVLFLSGKDADFKKAQKKDGRMAEEEKEEEETDANEHTTSGTTFTSDTHGGDDHPSLVEKVSMKKAGIKKWIKDIKTTMQGSMVRCPDDAIFEQVEHYLSALQMSLKRMEIQASAMVKRDHDISASMLEFGLACDALAFVEDNNVVVNNASSSPPPPSSYTNDDNPSTKKNTSSIGHVYRLIGNTVDEISMISAQYHDRKLSCFQEPLRDHLRVVHAAKVALSKRNNRRITYSTCINTVDTKKASLHKYRIMQDHKAIGLEASLSRAESEAIAAKANYEEVSARVLREVDRFRNENAVAMYATMTEFARAEKEHTEKMSMIWGVLLPHVEEMNATINFNGTKSFVEAAAVLREGSVNDTISSVTVPLENMMSMPMPMYPPPPVPSIKNNHNFVEATALNNGVVRYRDPLPEE